MVLGEKSMTLRLKQYGNILNSRSAGREAALTYLAYEFLNDKPSKLSLDFSEVVVMTPSWLSEFVQTLKEKGVKAVEFLPSENPTVISSIEFIEPEIN